MASIPGWLYLTIGLLVTLTSYFIGRSNNAMRVFTWVGLLLLAIGIFKLLVGYMTGRGKRDRSTSRSTAPGQNHLVCPRCNAKLHAQSRFCNWCGTRQ